MKNYRPNSIQVGNYHVCIKSHKNTETMEMFSDIVIGQIKTEIEIPSEYMKYFHICDGSKVENNPELIKILGQSNYPDLIGKLVKG